MTVGGTSGSVHGFTAMDLNPAFYSMDEADDIAEIVKPGPRVTGGGPKITPGIAQGVDEAAEGAAAATKIIQSVDVPAVPLQGGGGKGLLIGVGAALAGLGALWFLNKDKGEKTGEATPPADVAAGADVTDPLPVGSEGTSVLPSGSESSEVGIDPQTGLPINSETGLPLDPNMGGDVVGENPELVPESVGEQPVATDPSTGMPIDDAITDYQSEAGTTGAPGLPYPPDNVKRESGSDFPSPIDVGQDSPVPPKPGAGRPSPAEALGDDSALGPVIPSSVGPNATNGVGTTQNADFDYLRQTLDYSSLSYEQRDIIEQTVLEYGLDPAENAYMIEWLEQTDLSPNQEYSAWASAIEGGRDMYTQVDMFWYLDKSTSLSTSQQMRVQDAINQSGYAEQTAIDFFADRRQWNTSDERDVRDFEQWVLGGYDPNPWPYPGSGDPYYLSAEGLPAGVPDAGSFTGGGPASGDASASAATTPEPAIMTEASVPANTSETTTSLAASGGVTPTPPVEAGYGE